MPKFLIDKAGDMYHEECLDDAADRLTCWGLMEEISEVAASEVDDEDHCAECGKPLLLVEDDDFDDLVYIDEDAARQRHQVHEDAKDDDEVDEK